VLFPRADKELAGFESPFEEEVARVIKSFGYEVDPQVGTSRYRIDLGIKSKLKPASYILGIECDGATYHRSYNARDRDRIRQAKLEEYGWKIHRIWSTSWVRNRREESTRLVQAIKAAEGNEVGPSTTQPSSAQEQPRILPQEEIIEVSTPFIPIRDRIGVPYEVCNLSVRPALRAFIDRNTTPSNQVLEIFRNMVIALVRQEGPIHVENVYHRLSVASGYERTAGRITTLARRLVIQLRNNGIVIERRGFLWPAEMILPPVRFPTEVNMFSKRKIEYIPPEEIQLVMRKIMKLEKHMEANSLIEEAARFFGFSRTSEEIKQSLGVQAENLVARGELKKKDGLMTL
jgi:very-short-patch-repair endonuclease